MLGHGLKMSGNVVDDGENYALQTIKDNVSLLTPDLLDRINELVVKEGHKLLRNALKITSPLLILFVLR